MYSSKLRHLRDRNGISQKNLASILNIKNTTFCDYENGNQTIPLKHLITLCNYFNVSLDYVFDFTDKENYSNAKKEINLDITSKRLKEFRKNQKLTQLELANILKVARSIIAEYEKGKYLISLHALYTICKNYHYSADYLLGFIDKPQYLKVKD